MCTGELELTAQTISQALLRDFSVEMVESLTLKHPKDVSLNQPKVNQFLSDPWLSLKACLQSFSAILKGLPNNVFSDLFLGRFQFFLKTDV